MISLPHASPAPDSGAAAPPLDAAALVDPAAGVAPTLAILASAWIDAADDDVRERRIRPLLPVLAAGDGDAPDAALRRAADARRADIAATCASTIAGLVQAARSAPGAWQGALRRRLGGQRAGLLARFDALWSAVTDVEMGAALAAREARVARAAATVAAAPTAWQALEMVAIQSRAIGLPLAFTPGGPAPAEASPAWRDGWDAADPRAGAACFAAAHAGAVARMALAMPEVDGDAVHAALARAVERMAAVRAGALPVDAPPAVPEGAAPRDEREAELERLARLFGDAARERRPIEAGHAFRFDAEAFEELAQWVATERRRAPMIAFALELAPADGPIWLRVTEPE